MFRGMYNGKQHHVADIATVLSRAWSAGVDRIIVNSFAYFLFFSQQQVLDVFMLFDELWSVYWTSFWVLSISIKVLSSSRE